jgi:hypothetical protein
VFQLLLIPRLFFSFWQYWGVNSEPSLMLARLVLYLLSYSSNPFCF